MECVFLNIPNYYCSYYVFGLNLKFRVTYKPNYEFEDFNFKPYLIFSINQKIFVIDNNDPINPRIELLKKCEKYFSTNKLWTDMYQDEKIIPLFPHFPINVSIIYTKIFWRMFLNIRQFKNSIYLLRQLNQRPRYFECSSPSIPTKNYIFFISRLWQKEQIANNIRYSFIKKCKNDSRFDFEGGFKLRSDRQSFDFQDVIVNKKISATKFSYLSAQSNIVLNNPAVLGAISWRLAEYLRSGLFIISTKFMVELPVKLEHLKNIYSLNDENDISLALDLIAKNDDKINTIKNGALEYFLNYCTPEKQVDYILDKIYN